MKALGAKPTISIHFMDFVALALDVRPVKLAWSCAAMDFQEVLKRVSHVINSEVVSNPKEIPPLDEDYDVMAASVRIKPKDDIMNAGLDSLVTVAIVSRLWRLYPNNMPREPAFFFYYPTIEAIATIMHQGTDTSEPMRPEHVDPFPPKYRPFVPQKPELMPFSQLTGTAVPSVWRPLHLETKDGIRRQSDGMQCILIPGADVNIGGGTMEDARCNEQPTHPVRLSSFMMDIEPATRNSSKLIQTPCSCCHLL